MQVQSRQVQSYSRVSHSASTLASNRPINLGVRLHQDKLSLWSDVAAVTVWLAMVPGLMWAGSLLGL